MRARLYPIGKSQRPATRRSALAAARGIISNRKKSEACNLDMRQPEAAFIISNRKKSEACNTGRLLAPRAPIISNRKKSEACNRSWRDGSAVGIISNRKKSEACNPSVRRGCDCAIISNRKKSEACNLSRFKGDTARIISNRKKSEACNNTTRQRTRRPSIVFFGISPLLKPNPSPRPGGETRSMTEHQKGLRRKWQKSNPKRPHTTNRRPRASDSNRGFLSRAKSDSHSARASDSKIVFCVCARSSHAQAPGWTPAFAGEGERGGRGKENC